MKNKIKILNSKEKQKIIEKLKRQFGINEIPYILIKTGKEKIFAFSGNADYKQLSKILENLNIQGIGNYIAKEQDFKSNEEIRLSIEGTHFFKTQIKKNIFELNKEQLATWMHGHEILLPDNLVNKPKKGFVIMKYKNNFLGTGKASENKITNFIPKNRRLKEKT